MKNQKYFSLEKIKLVEEEEKALVGILYNHLGLGTTMEVFGEISIEGIKRLGLFRKTLAKLLKKYFLIDKLAEENYLLLGMKDFITKNTLVAWTKDKKNKHLQNRAKYFLKKYERK
jgi:hypothetical protein